MKFHSSMISGAVVLMAACSLFSMLGTLRVDQIVHGDLYRYGLQFSYAWATPYWTTTGVVFAMGWSIIVVAFIVELRLLAARRKASKQIASQAEKEMEPTEVVRDQEAGIPAEASECAGDEVYNSLNPVRKLDLKGKLLEIDPQESPGDSDIQGMLTLSVREKGTSNTFGVLVTMGEYQEIVKLARSGKPFTFGKRPPLCQSAV